MESGSGEPSPDPGGFHLRRATAGAGPTAGRRTPNAGRGPGRGTAVGSRTVGAVGRHRAGRQTKVAPGRTTAARRQMAVARLGSGGRRMADPDRERRQTAVAGPAVARRGGRGRMPCRCLVGRNGVGRPRIVGVARGRGSRRVVDPAGARRHLPLATVLRIRRGPPGAVPTRRQGHRGQGSCRLGGQMNPRGGPSPPAAGSPACPARRHRIGCRTRASPAGPPRLREPEAAPVDPTVSGLATVRGRRSSSAGGRAASSAARGRRARRDQPCPASTSRRQRWPSRVSSTAMPRAANSSRSRSDAAQSRAVRAATRSSRRA